VEKEKKNNEKSRFILDFKHKRDKPEIF